MGSLVAVDFPFNAVYVSIFFLSPLVFSEASLQLTPSGPKNSICHREVSATYWFFRNWLILLQKPALGCHDTVQLTQSVSRGQFERGKPKDYVRGYQIYMII